MQNTKSFSVCIEKNLPNAIGRELVTLKEVYPSYRTFIFLCKLEERSDYERSVCQEFFYYVSQKTYYKERVFC